MPRIKEIAKAIGVIFQKRHRIEVEQLFEEEYPGKFGNRSPQHKITAGYSIRVDGYLCGDGFDIFVIKTGKNPKIEMFV